MHKLLRTLAALFLALLATQTVAAAQAQEQQSLDELRNTVVNLLQALVDRGLITREQADDMVKRAEQKAAADAAVAAQKEKEQEKEEANAVRVPYVPQIVQDQIAKEVEQSVGPLVTQQIVTQAKSEGWGIPAALPDWAKRVTLSGDVRVRGEADVYRTGNARGAYLNLPAINAAGGIAEAGAAALLNTSTNRYYPLVRLRLNLDANLGGGWSIGSRISTGTLVNPDSLNQVLGQYGGRYTTDVDLAFIQWEGTASHGRQGFRFEAGKYPNPFLYTDLVWMPDVNFEGFGVGYRLGIAPNPRVPYDWFLTAVAVPEQNVPLTADYGPASNNKWLYAGQTGFDFQASAGSRLQFGVAYYDFRHMAGQRNTLFSNLLNYTAPPYMQKGNTVFDISNTNNPTSGNLFALASEFRELDYTLAYTLVVSHSFQFGTQLDYVKNVGYKADAVAQRVGYYVPPRVKGYEGQLLFGSPHLDHSGAWDAFVGYRYLQRDAVVDAFTDQDYHLGGTDARGYIAGVDASLTSRVWMRLRYMPFDAIDGPPLAIDVWHLDLNARF